MALKRIKQLICVLTAAVVAAAAMTACSNEEIDEPLPTLATQEATAETGVSETAEPTTKPASTDGVRKTDKLIGTGDNLKLSPSFSLYGKDYTLGVSTVRDMLDGGWVKNETSWEKIGENQKFAPGSKNIISKELDHDEKFAYISFRNVTDKTLTTNECQLSRFEFSGKADFNYDETDYTMYGGKLKLSECTDIPELEARLRKLVSSATRKVEGYYYSTYYKYTFKIKDGSSDLIVQTDSNTGRIRIITSSVTLAADYGEK